MIAESRKDPIATIEAMPDGEWTRRRLARRDDDGEVRCCLFGWLLEQAGVPRVRMIDKMDPMEVVLPGVGDGQTILEIVYGIDLNLQIHGTKLNDAAPDAKVAKRWVIDKIKETRSGKK